MTSSTKSCFERKRRDLSNKSNNEDERKKARECSLDLPLSKETNDELTEGIEFPRCASILYDYLKNLESKVNEIYKLSSSTKGAQIKDARQLEEISESIKIINEKFEKCEVARKQKEKEIAELKEDLASLKEKFIEVDKTLDCLLLVDSNSVQEGIVFLYMKWMGNNEDTDQAIINTVRNDLGMEITIHDIDRTHHLEKCKLDNNVPRLIIVTFARYNVRNRIFKAKKKLKGKM